MKDKMMLEKLLREEDNTLILNKINIHDELKEVMIGKHLDHKTHSQMLRESLVKDRKISMRRNDITGDSLNTTSTAYKKMKSSPLSSFIGANDSNGDSGIKRELHIDIGIGGDAKFNIISDSPIHYPVSKQSGKTFKTPMKKTNLGINKGMTRKCKSIEYNRTYDDATNMDTTNFIHTEIEEEIVTRLSVKKKSEIDKKPKPSPLTCKYKKNSVKSIHESKDKTVNTISTTMTLTTTSNSKSRKIAAISSLTSHLKK
jgi:hypothetical protein